MIISRYMRVILFVSIFFYISGLNIGILTTTGIRTSADTSVETVVCSEDSYVSENNPDKNHGSDSSFKVGYDEGYYDEAFFFFEIPSTIALDDIVSIELVLPIFYATADFQLNVYSTSGSWDENSITWNDKPSIDSFYGSISISESTSYTTTLYYLDLPIEGDSISICVKAPDSSAYILGDCKDGMSTGARIKITYLSTEEESNGTENGNDTEEGTQEEDSSDNDSGSSSNVTVEFIIPGFNLLFLAFFSLMGVVLIIKKTKNVVMTDGREN